jgi:exopolysaccharide biosynthesis polyprenyl glycosylphosphotransferase
MTPASTAQRLKQETGRNTIYMFPADVAHARPAVATPHAGAARPGPLAAELLRAVDVAVAVTVMVAVFVLSNTEQVNDGLNDFLLVRVSAKNLVLLASFVVLWPIVFALFGLYDEALRTNRKEEAVRVLGACSVGAIATVPFLLTSNSGSFQLDTVLLFWVCVVITTLAARLLLRTRLVPTLPAKTRDVLVVGSGPRALNLYHRLTHTPNSGSNVVGFVDSSAGMLRNIGRQPLGNLEELESILMHHAVDEVLIALPIKSCYSEIQEVIDVCERVGVEAHYLADVFEHSLAKPRYVSSAAVPLMVLKVAPDDIRLVVKRIADLVGATVGLIILAPLFLLIAAAIKLTSPGPVFFAQQRYGYNRRVFRMYKFRTMVPEAEALQAALEHLNEAEGPVFKIKDDPRIIPVGRLLRRTSLDELPQLLNVLIGDMSLVGPRPLPMRDVQNFSEAWLMRRFSVVPGCTGLWQVSGRSNLGFDDWVTMDLRYIDQWSLWMDFKILLRTIPAVLRGSGAS